MKKDVDFDLGKGQRVFDVVDKTAQPPKIINAIRRGISMVLDKHGSQSQKVSIGVYPYFTHEGRPVDLSAQYDPDADLFAFAVDTMREKINVRGLDDEGKALLVAAHEATHKVQVERGDKPDGTIKKYGVKSSPQALSKDRHEQEAWSEAVHVFKKVYPHTEGEIELGGVVYKLPKESKY